MARIASILIPLFLLAIAGGVAATVQRLVGLTLGETIAVGLGVLFALAMIETRLQRGRERALLDRRLQDVATFADGVSRAARGFDSRLDAVERRTADGDRDDPGERQVLTTLVGQLAEAVAVLDLRLDRLEGRSAPAAPVTLHKAPAAVAVADAAPPERRGRDDARLREEVRKAVRVGRIEFTLQPIVTLPQRRPRYYEVGVLLRDEAGGEIRPAEYTPAAAALGLMPELDRACLNAASEVLRRLSARQREVGVFCNVSVASLGESRAFSGLLDFANLNKAAAENLILAFGQAAVLAMGPIEQESLAALADLGYRFALDRAVDLKVDYQGLAGRRFRFVKTPVESLLGATGRRAPDIAPADMADMLARFGIDMIVEHVDAEMLVPDLLDHGVKLGQGLVFGPPQGIRADGTAEPARRAAAS